MSSLVHGSLLAVTTTTAAAAGTSTSSTAMITTTTIGSMVVVGVIAIYWRIASYGGGNSRRRGCNLRHGNGDVVSEQCQQQQQCQTTVNSYYYIVVAGAGPDSQGFPSSVFQGRLRTAANLYLWLQQQQQQQHGKEAQPTASATTTVNKIAVVITGEAREALPAARFFFRSLPPLNSTPPPAVLVELRSRTTFENAFWASKLIHCHQYHSQSSSPSRNQEAEQEVHINVSDDNTNDDTGMSYVTTYEDLEEKCGSSTSPASFRVIVVSDGFHLFRCGLLFRKASIPISSNLLLLPSSCSSSSSIPTMWWWWIFREMGALAKGLWLQHYSILDLLRGVLTPTSFLPPIYYPDPNTATILK